MKKILTYTLTTMVATLLIVTASVASETETRYKSIEMADGNYVQFKMTPEEIAAEDAARERLEAIRIAEAEQPREWVKRVELPESGAHLEFPMSRQEIQIAMKQEALERAERQEAQRTCLLEAQDVERDVIEMADGNMIAFERESGAVEIGMNLSEHVAC